MKKLEFVKTFMLKEEDKENFDPKKALCINHFLNIDNEDVFRCFAYCDEYYANCNRCWDKNLADFEVIYLLGKLTQKLRKSNRRISNIKNKKIEELKEEIELYKNACIVSDNKFFNLKEAFEQLKESYEKIIYATEDIENERVDE